MFPMRQAFDVASQKFVGGARTGAVDPTRDRIRAAIRRYLIAAAWVYFTLLAFWAAAYLLTGDRYPLIALFNLVAPYLFIPAVAVFPLAVLARRRELWLGLAISLGLFVLLWGALFIPFRVRSPTGQAILNVMNYNVFASNRDTNAVIRIIQEAGSDLVFIQELTPALADAIEVKLSDAYPYRVLDPQEGVTGMGTLSKYPLRESGDSLPLNWVGEPQVLLLDWAGEEVMLINFHMWPLSGRSVKYLALNYRAREAQALHLAEFARQKTGEFPVVVAGDANATDLSDGYSMLVESLNDSWREAGIGFGHTYPGPASRGIQGLNWRMPKWLARIDYIFHSDHWQAIEVGVSDSAGGSDHRAVVAELVLLEH